jgi:hypothetical protein
MLVRLIEEDGMVSLVGCGLVRGAGSTRIEIRTGILAVGIGVEIVEVGVI